MFGGIYDMMMREVGFMKMDAHQEKMIGWTLFIVGYFSNLGSKQKNY